MKTRIRQQPLEHMRRTDQRAVVARGRGGVPPGSESAATFRARVQAIVRAIPRGKVITYGQIALLAGRPRGARQVGWIAHSGGSAPWQRVVNSAGGLAEGYTGGREGHRRALARDGVRIGPDGRVDLKRYLWWPDARTRKRLRLDA